MKCGYMFDIYPRLEALKLKYFFHTTDSSNVTAKKGFYVGHP